MEEELKGHAGVYFWMQRVAEEYRKQVVELINDMELLHWQTINLESMPEDTQTEVIKQVKERMKNLGWSDSQIRLSKTTEQSS